MMVTIKNSLKIALCAIALIGAASSAMADPVAVSGKILSINVHPGWNGVFIQLVGVPTINFTTSSGTTCSASSVFLLSTSNMYKDVLATALAARASNAPVTIYASGCAYTGTTSLYSLTLEGGL